MVPSISFVDEGREDWPEEVWEQKSSLQELVLSRNSIGAIPPKIVQLSSLRILLLDNNALTCIPHEIGQLSCLVTLDLHSNFIESIPVQLGACIRLTALNLLDNPLTGPAPPDGERSWSRLYLGAAQQPGDVEGEELVRSLTLRLMTYLHQFSDLEQAPSQQQQTAAKPAAPPVPVPPRVFPSIPSHSMPNPPFKPKPSLPSFRPQHTRTSSSRPAQADIEGRLHRAYASGSPTKLKAAIAAAEATDMTGKQVDHAHHALEVLEEMQAATLEGSELRIHEAVHAWEVMTQPAHAHGELYLAARVALLQFHKHKRAWVLTLTAEEIAAREKQRADAADKQREAERLRDERQALGMRGYHEWIQSKNESAAQDKATLAAYNDGLRQNALEAHHRIHEQHIRAYERELHWPSRIVVVPPTPSFNIFERTAPTFPCCSSPMSSSSERYVSPTGRDTSPMRSVDGASTIESHPGRQRSRPATTSSPSRARPMFLPGEQGRRARLMSAGLPSTGLRPTPLSGLSSPKIPSPTGGNSLSRPGQSPNGTLRSPTANGHSRLIYAAKLAAKDTSRASASSNDSATLASALSDNSSGPPTAASKAKPAATPVPGQKAGPGPEREDSGVPVPADYPSPPHTAERPKGPRRKDMDTPLVAPEDCKDRPESSYRPLRTDSHTQARVSLNTGDLEAARSDGPGQGGAPSVIMEHPADELQDEEIPEDEDHSDEDEQDAPEEGEEEQDTLFVEGGKTGAHVVALGGHGSTAALPVVDSADPRATLATDELLSMKSIKIFSSAPVEEDVEEEEEADAAELTLQMPTPRLQNPAPAKSWAPNGDVPAEEPSAHLSEVPAEEEVSSAKDETEDLEPEDSATQPEAEADAQSVDDAAPPDEEVVETAAADEEVEPDIKLAGDAASDAGYAASDAEEGKEADAAEPQVAAEEGEEADVAEAEPEAEPEEGEQTDAAEPQAAAQEGEEAVIAEEEAEDEEADAAEGDLAEAAELEAEPEGGGEAEPGEGEEADAAEPETEAEEAEAEEGEQVEGEEGEAAAETGSQPELKPEASEEGEPEAEPGAEAGAEAEPEEGEVADGAEPEAEAEAEDGEETIAAEPDAEAEPEGDNGADPDTPDAEAEAEPEGDEEADTTEPEAETEPQGGEQADDAELEAEPQAEPEWGEAQADAAQTEGQAEPEADDEADHVDAEAAKGGEAVEPDPEAEADAAEQAAETEEGDEVDAAEPEAEAEPEASEGAELEAEGGEAEPEAEAEPEPEEGDVADAAEQEPEAEPEEEADEAPAAEEED